MQRIQIRLEISTSTSCTDHVILEIKEYVVQTRGIQTELKAAMHLVGRRRGSLNDRAAEQANTTQMTSAAQAQGNQSICCCMSKYFSMTEQDLAELQTNRIVSARSIHEMADTTLADESKCQTVLRKRVKSIDANNVINMEIRIMQGIPGKSVNCMNILSGQQRCTSSWARLSSEDTKQFEKSDVLTQRTINFHGRSAHPCICVVDAVKTSSTLTTSDGSFPA
jgi:hypothetical protein